MGPCGGATRRLGAGSFGRNRGAAGMAAHARQRAPSRPGTRGGAIDRRSRRGESSCRQSGTRQAGIACQRQTHHRGAGAAVGGRQCALRRLSAGGSGDGRGFATCAANLARPEERRRGADPDPMGTDSRASWAVAGAGAQPIALPRSRLRLESGGDTVVSRAGADQQDTARPIAASGASHRPRHQGSGGRRCMDRGHRPRRGYGGRFASDRRFRQGTVMNPMGIFGGTFDPIHYAHLRTAFELQQALRLMEIRFLPAGNPPHRDQPLADAQLRLQMVQLATAGQAGFVVDDREVRKEGPSYSVETLAELRHEYPDRSLCLIVGMDAFLSLPKWYQWRELLQLAHLVVAHRPGWRAPGMGPLGELLVDRGTGRIGDLHESRAGCIYIHAVTQLEISSTEVRQLIGMGRDPRFLMPDAVRKLILDTHCYSKPRTT